MDLAQELLRRQANPDSVDIKGKSAMHRAARYKHNQMMQLLIVTTRHSTHCGVEGCTHGSPYTRQRRGLMGASAP